MNSVGYSALQSAPQRIAGILAMLALIWCMIAKISLFDTLFRVAVVYLAISIIGLIVTHQWTKFTAEAIRAKNAAPPVSSPDLESGANEAVE